MDIQECMEMCTNSSNLNDRLRAAREFIDYERQMNFFKREIKHKSPTTKVRLFIDEAGMTKEYALGIFEVVKLMENLEWKERRS